MGQVMDRILIEDLKQLPPPGTIGGCYHKMFGVMQRAIRRGCSDGEIHDAVESILNRNPSAGRVIPTSDIQNSIDRARSAVNSDDYVRRPKPRSIDAEKAQAQVQKYVEMGKEKVGTDDICDLEWFLYDNSPIKFENDFRDFLWNMYDLGEYLYIGTKYGTRVFTMAEHLEFFEDQGQIGDQICINPFDGKRHENSNGKRSFRCDRAVKHFRYYCVEFDNVELNDQLLFWIGTGAEIMAIVYSGSKSYHVWFQAPYCQTKEDWDREVKRGIFQRKLAQFGVDPSTSNPSRMMRTPGVMRNGDGPKQALLWLSREPQSIVKECV